MDSDVPTQQPQNPQRLRKWLTFSVRWAIAIGGITLVLWNISFHDRVRVLDPGPDPGTGAIHKLRVLGDAKDGDIEFRVVAADGAERVYARDELWVRPDRKTVPVRGPSGDVRSLKLLAVKPGEEVGARRAVRALLVEDPDSERGRIVTPAELSGVNDSQSPPPTLKLG